MNNDHPAASPLLGTCGSNGLEARVLEVKRHGCWVWTVRVGWFI